ncbi:MAG: CocE/NonD family hydrolase [Solirubrobacteraceae bacterium]
MLALAVPVAAHAQPAPFGHACVAQNGVRFCPTTGDDQRVPTWDGVPIDADVTFPADGEGPFPTLAMLHGFPGSKSNFESSGPDGANSTLQHYTNVFYASGGWAVVNHSSRGFGRSCGVPASRTAGCERGWFHLADQRYEVRDTQYLLGLLVDAGIADPGRLAATGVSYGGGQSMQLAFLRDRVRTEDGALVPWLSPAGRPLSIAAAYARWGWSDLVYALAPNGRLMDAVAAPRDQSRDPLGIGKQPIVDTLYLGGAGAGFLAPPGADPTADLGEQHDLLDAGEPPSAALVAGSRQTYTYRSAYSLASDGHLPAPLLIENGWTDDIFPAEQALRVYTRFAGSRADLSLMLGDLGHFRGSNKAAVDLAFNDRGAAFLDARGRGMPGGPRAGSVIAYTQTCPKDAVAGGPFRAAAYPALARGSVRIGGRRAHTIPSDGGDDAVSAAVGPVTNSDACTSVGARRLPGTAVFERRSRGFTLLGLPTVTARVRTRGAFPQLDARLWDVGPDGTQVLVSHGAYRFAPGEKPGTIVFQLFGNGWRFAAGHKVRLELLGRDPQMFRPSNGSFSVRVADVAAHLPVRERPSRSRGIEPPPSLFD